MKHVFKTIIIAGAVASLVISGCTKKSDSAAGPSTPATSAPSITINDGYGVLSAVRSVSYTTIAGYTVPLEVNTAVAAFTLTTGSGTFTDGGTVTLNSKSLTKSTNNAYVYQNLTDPLSFSQFAWNVTGSASVPAISYTNNNLMTDYSGFSSLPSAITKANGVTISLGSAVSSADSVYVVVTDYSNHVIMKRLAGNAGECVIAAADLSGFTAGKGMVQVCPWNYKSQDFNGKKIYFINESAFTKQGITIN